MSDRGKMERAAFEAWAREYGMIAADRGDMILAWDAWQASLRAHRGAADASPPAPAWSGESVAFTCSDDARARLMAAARFLEAEGHDDWAATVRMMTPSKPIPPPGAAS